VVDLTQYHCSFCGSAAGEVERLVGGPGVAICNECVVRCQQILTAGPDRDQGAPLFSVVIPPIGSAEDERDRRLVSDHLRGDSDAFFVIVDQYAASLREEAESLLGVTSEPDTAVHETFLRAIAAIRQFDRSGQWQLRPWLSSILRQVCSERHGEPRID
jgi:ClpX C4-type zinc finger/Sigma-70 region 2